MKIAVVDANIFIDLIELDLLSFLFDLDMEIRTTRTMYDQLSPDQKIMIDPFIKSGVLFIYNLNFKELKEIYLKEFPRGFDPTDKSFFYYAKKIEGSMLTGDRKLKAYCKSQSFEVHDVVWIFDNFVTRALITESLAAAKLELLISINDRVPLVECKRRIRMWNLTLR